MNSVNPINGMTMDSLASRFDDIVSTDILTGTTSNDTVLSSKSINSLRPTSSADIVCPTLLVNNVTDHSLSTASSWCNLDQRRPHIHGDESIPIESVGERISTHAGNVAVITSTMKQSRTVSVGDDESSPVTKKQKRNKPPPHNHRPVLPREVALIAPKPSNTLTLLANPKDALVLSDLHVFVRLQIEVFRATESDITQPAPGRKHRIQLNQVGLRCIHCRNLPARDRVKRAVCYPSSIARVYHSVSDMKFDHFTHCKGRSSDVCAKFQSLKDECKQKRYKKSTKPINHSSSSSTAQYYHDSAYEMGMIDGPGGLFMKNSVNNIVAETCTDPHGMNSLMDVKETTKFGAESGLMSILPTRVFDNDMEALSGSESARHIFIDNDTNMRTKAVMMSSFAKYLFGMNSATAPSPERIINVPSNTQNIAMVSGSLNTSSSSNIETLKESGACLLTSSTDIQYLNPIHCFVRRHIQLFVADRDDINAPAPGRKTRVVLGQVGLRCIHCSNIPMKDRVKRAVCYPASISGIYHAVSNMKFDHFNKCRALPPNERDIFISLRTSCGRHGPRHSGVNIAAKTIISNSNSTAQYYHDSAIALGLADSENGIRFHHDMLSLPNQHFPMISQTVPSRKSRSVSELSKVVMKKKSISAAGSTSNTTTFFDHHNSLSSLDAFTASIAFACQNDESRTNPNTSAIISSSSSTKETNNNSAVTDDTNAHDGISALMIAASVRVAAAAAAATGQYEAGVAATKEQRREAVV